MLNFKLWKCRVDKNRYKVYSTGKAIPLQAWTIPESSRRLGSPRFQGNRHMKAVRLPTLRTGYLYPPENIPGTYFCLSLSQPQERSKAGRIMSIKIPVTPS